MLKNTPIQALLPVAMGLVLITIRPAAAEVVAYSESFDYSSTSELQAAWTDADGTGSFMSLDANFTAAAPEPDKTITPAHAPVGRVPNSLVYDTLDQTVTDSWTLSFKALHTHYSRGMFVALMNADGTEGYGVNWDSAAVNQFEGTGLIRIRKWDLDSPWTAFGTTGSALATLDKSGHPVTGYAVTAVDGSEPAKEELATYSDTFSGFAEFELTWDKESGKLTVSVDGSEIGSATDTDFSTFSRIYLRGNTDSVFDDIQVTTVPEPGAMGLFVTGLILAAGRRSRKTQH